MLYRVLAGYIIATVLLTAPALARFQVGDELRVVNIKDNDVLNIRELPTERSRIVGSIPSCSGGVIYLGKSAQNWILVQYGKAEGWVNRCFLSLPVSKVGKGDYSSRGDYSRRRNYSRRGDYSLNAPIAASMEYFDERMSE
jgi:hypothetical protein